MKTGLVLFGSLALVTSSSLASAHIVMTSPTPRSDQPLKSAPCGGVQAGNNPMALTAGQQVTVTWDETIDHTGCFVIDLSTTGDDQNFQPLMTVPDPQNQAPKSYSQQVTIPAGASCAKCTLRVRQLMGADPSTCGPTTMPTDGTYYACADVKIDGAGGSTGGGTDAGSGSGSGTGTGGGTGTGTGSGSGSGSGTGASAGGGAATSGDGGFAGALGSPTSSAATSEQFADTGCGIAPARKTALGAAGGLGLALAGLALVTRRRRRYR